MSDLEFPAPSEGFVVTHTIMVRDIPTSVAFYRDVLGGRVVFDGGEGAPAMLKLSNIWVIINVGGGPTEDKPTVTLAPPENLDLVDSFINIRVADIQARYDEWRSRGAEFLTPPMDRGGEIRCYMRDPDGYLIEVGQATGILDRIQ